MFQIVEHTRLGVNITLVHQYCATAQEIAVAFKRQIDNRVKEWVPRSDESGERLALWCHERFFKGNTLVAWQDRLANANCAGAIAHGGWHVGNLVTVRPLDTDHRDQGIWQDTPHGGIGLERFKFHHAVL
jgi:hypothetical protein